MQIYLFLILFIVAGTAISVYTHLRFHQVFSLSQAFLAFFLVINILICFWELCLSIHIKTIKAEYIALQKKYGKNPVQAVNKLFFTDLTMLEILTLKTWTKIWATYALYDVSYADQESFGFFVDFGNGWVTLLPSLLFLYSMTFHDLISARVLGIIGMVKFYQECYGTLLSFVAYIYTERYAGKSKLECFLVVGMSNSLWLFGPLFG